VGADLFNEKKNKNAKGYMEELLKMFSTHKCDDALEMENECVCE
jgi:hypothetical protein